MSLTDFYSSVCCNRTNNSNNKLNLTTSPSSNSLQAVLTEESAAKNPDHLESVVVVGTQTSSGQTGEMSSTASSHSADNSSETSSELELSMNGALASGSVSFTRQDSTESAGTTVVSPFIVNCCSGYIEKPVKWGPLPVMVANSYLRTPIQNAVRYPNCKITNNKFAHLLNLADSRKSLAEFKLYSAVFAFHPYSWVG